MLETQSEGPVTRNSRASLLGWPLAIFAFLAVIFAYGLTTGDPSRLPSTLLGKTAPAVALPGIDGLMNGAAGVPGFDSSDRRFRRNWTNGH